MAYHVSGIDKHKQPNSGKFYFRLKPKNPQLELHFHQNKKENPSSLARSNFNFNSITNSFPLLWVFNK
ncbi:hypothetical protein Lal_00036345 [Lupinus albus]|nr:hypothetical protein Lal_00036345 [Lupinus albus]